MRLRRPYRVLVIWIANISVLISQVNTTGIFELNLKRFENENGVNADGNCCAGVRTGARCTSWCRTFFRVCLTHYQATITDDVHCNFAEKFTPVLTHGNNSVDFSNLPVKFDIPIKFPFQFAWPGTFTLIIEAWHDSTQQGPTTGSTRELIYRLQKQRSVEVGSSWKQFTRTENTMTLEYAYKVECGENYYGPGCVNYCRPRDDSFGHYVCDEYGQKVCMQGWKGDYCDQAVCLPGCHPDHGFCDKPSECQCRAGYEGNFCDTCIRYPGCLHGTCTEPWQCNCREGWGGLFCNQDLNYCTHHSPCRNGGICKNTGQGSYTCDCPSGFMGTNCEVEVNNCEQQPCANGGTCKTVGEGYVCDCPEGFTGRRCDIVGSSCETNPCLNNGTCIQVDGVYQCKCMEGFTGFYCDVERNECVSRPCQNGGRCIDEVNGFRCICTAEYKGPTCNENIDNCANNPCYNDGTCIDGDNDFTCRCRPGFVGQLCQENVPDCDARPCANGGTCHDEINDFRCSCAIGWEGKDCSIKINECESSPCQNGGVCTDFVGYYECKCASGFYGNNCENSNGQPPSTATPKPQPAANSSSALMSEGKSSEITMIQLVLIVCLGAGIPLLLIILVVIFLLLRKRNAPTERLDTSKEHQQNVVNNINNKLSESPIFTTSSTISGKLTNEKQNDFNNYSASGGHSSSDKSNNKVLLNSKDLNIHHEQFSKTPPASTGEKYNYDPDAARGGGCSVMKSNNENSSSCYDHNASIHTIGKSKAFQRDADRNSTLFLDHPSVHRHSFLATEV